MDKPISQATELNLEHFQACMPLALDNTPTPELTAFLQRVLSENGNLGRYSLPSLSDMARFFNSNHMQVYDAMRGLRKCGFDFNLEKLENRIFVWKI